MPQMLTWEDMGSYVLKGPLEPSGFEMSWRSQGCGDPQPAQWTVQLPDQIVHNPEWEEELWAGPSGHAQWQRRHLDVSPSLSDTGTAMLKSVHKLSSNREPVAYSPFDICPLSIFILNGEWLLQTVSKDSNGFSLIGITSPVLCTSSLS